MRKDKKNVMIFICISIILVGFSYFMYSYGITDTISKKIFKLSGSALKRSADNNFYPTINLLINSSGEKQTYASVTITIMASDKNKIIKSEYSFDQKKWFDDFDEKDVGTSINVRKTFTKSMNRVVYFRVTDDVGNESKIVKTNINIIK